MHTQRNGAAADAVYAQYQVKNRAKCRQKPDESEPERRGPGIAFMEQGMNRGQQGSQKTKTRGQMRPEPEKFDRAKPSLANFMNEA
jgi:hypothetical protein